MDEQYGEKENEGAEEHKQEVQKKPLTEQELEEDVEIILTETDTVELFCLWSIAVQSVSRFYYYYY